MYIKFPLGGVLSSVMSCFSQIMVIYGICIPFLSCVVIEKKGYKTLAHCTDLRPSVSVVQDLDILVFAEDSCAGSLEYIVRHCVATLNLLVVNNCAATLKSHHMAAQYDGT